jgi:hypothetical protein
MLMYQKDGLTPTPKSLQPSPSNAIITIPDSAPTASTHGLTPSPPSGSTITPADPGAAEAQGDNSSDINLGNININGDSSNGNGDMNMPNGNGAGTGNADPNANDASNFTDFNNDPAFNMDTNGFDFGLAEFDGGDFDFGMYLAELGGDTEGGEVALA